MEETTARAVTLRQARAQFANLLDLTQYQGQQVTLTRYGKPAALLTPPTAEQDDNPPDGRYNVVAARDGLRRLVTAAERRGRSSMILRYGEPAALVVPVHTQEGSPQ